MNYQLVFTESLTYDPGRAGITVDVTLSLSRDTVDCEAKIDTGASFCIFARNIGEELGIEVESGIRQLIGTVTGNFVVYLHEVNLSVPGVEMTALVGFAENAAFRRNVLGRRGFLEQVTLGLVDYEGKLYLSRYVEE